MWEVRKLIVKVVKGKEKYLVRLSEGKHSELLKLKSLVRRQRGNTSSNAWSADEID